jgi:two-component system phosphate regulon response regulator PhoB
MMARAFTREGFTVTEAATGAAAREALAAHPPDCVLLDLMLPDVSGLAWCRELKADPRTSAIPVVMVTARGEEVDRVVGFELGADDYVPKPFSPRELVLRVKAILRRREPASPTAAAPLAWGSLALDETAHRATVDGQDAALTALEFKLLAQLMRRPGQVQTREALLDRVWGYAAGVTTRTLDTHVKRLRGKLGAARAAVETVRGIGYRLAEPPAGTTRPPARR